MPADVCLHPWAYDVKPFRILGPLYYVGNRAVSAYLLDCGPELALIDAGYPQTVHLLLESIRRLGFDPQKVRHILNTHAHYDHVGGTRSIAALTGARTYLGRDDVDLVERRHELTEADLAGFQFHEAYRPDVALADGDVVTIGPHRIRCLHTPGHTPGTMSFVFELALEGRHHLAGMHGGPGLATLTDEYLARHGLPVDLRSRYAEGVKRLKAEPVDVHLATHPGQNRTFQRMASLATDPSAFVDPAAWPAYLDGLMAAFRRRFPSE